MLVARGSLETDQRIPIMHNVVVFLEKSGSVVMRKNILYRTYFLMFKLQHKNQANTSNGQNQGVVCCSFYFKMVLAGNIREKVVAFTL